MKKWHVEQHGKALKHSQLKKPHRKSHPDHSHLVTLNPWRFLIWGKAPVIAPENENGIRMEKDICTKLGQLMKVELLLWIGLKCGTIIIPHFGVMGWFPEKVTLFWAKHIAVFGVNVEKFVPLLKVEAFENLLESKLLSIQPCMSHAENQRWHWTLQHRPRLNQTKFNESSHANCLILAHMVLKVTIGRVY